MTLAKTIRMVVLANEKDGALKLSPMEDGVFFIPGTVLSVTFTQEMPQPGEVWPTAYEIHNRFCGVNDEVCQAHKLMQEHKSK